MKKIKQTEIEIQVCQDVVNLYLSVKLERSIQVIIEFLQENGEELKKRIKVNLTDIYQFLELCLRECFFYNNIILMLENLTPMFHFLRFSDIVRRHRSGTYTHLQYCQKKTSYKKLKNSTVKIAEIDPTLRFTKKIQKIYQPRKKKRFTDLQVYKNISEYIRLTLCHQDCMVQ